MTFTCYVGWWRPRAYHIYPLVAIEMVLLVLPSSFLPVLFDEFWDFDIPKATLYKGLSDSIGSFIGFLINPAIGALSDQYGRRSGLIVTVILSTIPSFALAGLPHISLWWYYYANVIGRIGAYGMISSYIADLTTDSPEQRQLQFALTMAFMFFLLTMSGLIGLYLTQYQSFQLGAGLGAAVILYTIFFLPESCSPEMQRMNRVRAPLLNPNGKIGKFMNRMFPVDEDSKKSKSPNIKEDKQPLVSGPESDAIDQNVLTSSLLEDNDPINSKIKHDHILPIDTANSAHLPPSAINSPGKKQILTNCVSFNPFVNMKFLLRREYFFLALTVFLSQMATNGISEVNSQYLISKVHFGLTDKNDFVKLTVMTGLVTGFCLAVIQPIAMRFVSDKIITIIALFSNLARTIYYIYIQQKGQAYVAAFIGCMSYADTAATTSILSNNVSDADQGIAIGALSAVKALTFGAGPFLFSMTFVHYSDYKNSDYDLAFPYYLGCGFLGASILTALLIPRPLYINNRPVATDHI